MTFLLALALQAFVADESMALGGPARPNEYMEASGRRAAFFGREDGSFEAWVYPMKVLRGFELLFELSDYATPIPAASLATDVEVRPETSKVRFAHASFSAVATWFVPLEESGGIVLIDVDASDPLTIHARFHPELKLMWPAGLGGQYSYWDEELNAWVITESTRGHAAIVGSPLASRPANQPAHNLPDAPIGMRLPVESGLAPIAIAGSVDGLDDALATYRRLLADHARLREETAAHYRTLREERVRLDSPDDELDLAFEWGKVALDKGFVCNPQLGCGLVAGLGPSGRSERPGFGWYFGGDALFNLWAITAYGDFELAEQTLLFLRERQREDGKMMHELSQGAAYIPWFEEFPYGYYHADTTPLYIVAVRDYVRASGNLEFARQMWPSVQRAYEYCLSADENGDGLMDNTLAGLAAVETGALRTGEVLTDVYLASVWTEAKRAVRELASALLQPVPLTLPDVLSDSFVHQSGIAFALLTNGEVQREDTPWPAFGLWRGLVRSDEALDALASNRLGSDWGARMLSRESALYDHKSYNNGGVWPFLTGYATLALYANGRTQAAWSFLEGVKELTFLHARGYVTEILSGDRLVPNDASVPHQLFSTSGLVSPLLRGLVGYEPGRLAPRPPPGWDRFRVENLRHPSGRFSFDWERIRGDEEDRIRVRLDGDVGDIEVSLDLPSGIETWVPEPGQGLREHVFRFAPSVEIRTVHEPLRPGDRSRRLRVLEETYDGDTFRARLEARSGSRHRLRARIPGEILSIANGRRDGEWIDVSFPEGGGEFSTVELVVTMRRR